MGVDSTAMLVGLQARGIRPDLILFADTGDEKQATYDYLPVINAWLVKVGFPQVTVVKLVRPKLEKKGIFDRSLSDSLLRLGTLPAPSYGSHHTCTQVWKMAPQATFLKSWQPALDTWAQGGLVQIAVGYDNGDADGKRCAKAYGKNLIDGKTTNVYPLREWGWDRERCQAEIAAAGLPVPMKSACFHCPNSKLWEIDWLVEHEPKLAQRAIEIEAASKASGKAKTIPGIGRNFAWTDHILQQSIAKTDALLARVDAALAAA